MVCSTLLPMFAYIFRVTFIFAVIADRTALNERIVIKLRSKQFNRGLPRMELNV